MFLLCAHIWFSNVNFFFFCHFFCFVLLVNCKCIQITTTMLATFYLYNFFLWFPLKWADNFSYAFFFTILIKRHISMPNDEFFRYKLNARRTCFFLSFSLFAFKHNALAATSNEKKNIMFFLLCYRKIA